MHQQLHIMSTNSCAKNIFYVNSIAIMQHTYLTFFFSSVEQHKTFTIKTKTRKKKNRIEPLLWSPTRIFEGKKNTSRSV